MFNTINKIYFFAFSIFIIIAINQLIFDKPILLVLTIIGLDIFCDYLVVLLAMNHRLPRSFRTQELNFNKVFNTNKRINVEEIRKDNFIRSAEGKKLMREAYLYCVFFLFFTFMPLIFNIEDI